MMEGIYKLEYSSHYSVVNGVFIYDSDKFDRIKGHDEYMSEYGGKYCDFEYKPYDHMTLLSNDEALVKWWDEKVGNVGHVPFEDKDQCKGCEGWYDSEWDLEDGYCSDCKRDLEDDED